jgi:signal transduction histidine kinase
LKYSEKNSSVIVSAIDSYQGVYNIDNVPGALFQITDSGRGISEEDIPHLFERFFRSKEVKDLSGSGLGLNIAKEIVDLHSGHIFVRSSLEKGSTFTVFIPNQVEPSSR